MLYHLVNVIVLKKKIKKYQQQVYHDVIHHKI